MIRKIACLFTILSILGCEEEVVEKPDNLIPKNTMVAILYDLAMVSAAKNTNPSILEDHGLEAMPYVYEKYGIDSIQFVQSDLYYASKPDEYEAIYKILESRLEREKDALEEVRRQRNDSLRVLSEKRRLQDAGKDVNESRDSLP